MQAHISRDYLAILAASGTNGHLGISLPAGETNVHSDPGALEINRHGSIGIRPGHLLPDFTTIKDY
jgi:hypothetical protein